MRTITFIVFIISIKLLVFQISIGNRAKESITGLYLSSLTLVMLFSNDEQIFHNY